MKIIFTALFNLCVLVVVAQKKFELTSADQQLKVTITAGSNMQWSLQYNGNNLIEPSTIALHLANETLGENVNVTSNQKTKENKSFEPINYHKKTIKDEYTQLTLN